MTSQLPRVLGLLAFLVNFASPSLCIAQSYLCDGIIKSRPCDAPPLPPPPKRVAESSPPPTFVTASAGDEFIVRTTIPFEHVELPTLEKIGYFSIGGQTLPPIKGKFTQITTALAFANDTALHYSTANSTPLHGNVQTDQNFYFGKPPKLLTVTGRMTIAPTAPAAMYSVCLNLAYRGAEDRLMFTQRLCSSLGVSDAHPVLPPTAAAFSRDQMPLPPDIMKSVRRIEITYYEAPRSLGSVREQ